MRTPQDLPPRAARPARAGRGRWWVLGAVVVLIILLASLKSLATIYTDNLWFSSVDLHRVWSTLLEVKVGLFACFGAAFFVLLWANLTVCDRLSARDRAPNADDELVRRYQRVVRPHAGLVHAVVAVLIAIIGGAAAVGQWNNWLLFTHSQSFGVKDPQFGLDDGFFVFKLPFLQFLVDWALAVLVVVFVVAVVFHYLNGGIRAKRNAPRVQPLVKVHLSVLLALIAVVKAVAYLLQRYGLDLSTNGYVDGAGYTDVHARLPALEVLFFVSLFSAAILLYNIRRQGWTLPVLAVGLWAFVALVIGVIYPVLLQTLHVNPAQSSLERKYIARNIEATRTAYGLKNVKVTATFTDTTKIKPSAVDSDLTSLENIRLWDPSPTVSGTAFKREQGLSAYYDFPTVQVDRYMIDGSLQPVVVGVRQIDPTDLASPSWVNTHLEYTHGEGIVIADANKVTGATPQYTIKDLPPDSTNGFPKVTQPAVYFGVTEPGYVIADTNQTELTYQNSSGNNVDHHYKGSGGVTLGGFFTRAAFAVRLGDLNLLLSNLITPDSKMMFVRTVRQMAQKAAPFLSFDSEPYPVLVDGHIDWLLNGYTTTADYPYSQNADSVDVPLGSGLPASYDYVRNSVEVVVNGYSGKMTFYALDNDPILRAYEAAFPKMFEPKTAMPPAIRAHLRYGQDMFAVQAAMYGRYHITSPSAFYSAGDAWVVAPTLGVGTSKKSLEINYVVNAQGQVVSGTYQPMTPLYQVLAPPGQHTQSFTITDAYVPKGDGSAATQVLRAVLIGSSDPSDFGHLHVYETKPGSSKIGPILADSKISSTTAISKTLTLLDTKGSRVLLGNTLVVPVGDSVMYVRPLYVESTTVPQPQLERVIGVLGPHVVMRTTLDSMLDALLGTALRSTSTKVTTTSHVTSRSNTGTLSEKDVATASTDLMQASKDFAAANAALTAGKLGTYQSDVAAAQQLTTDAEKLLATATNSATSSSTTPASASTSTPASTTGTADSPSKAVSDGSTGSGSTTATLPGVSTSTTTAPGET